MPKRKPPQKREANGRRSRRVASIIVQVDSRKVAWTKEDQDTVAVALEARQRVFGLSPKDARDQKAATAIGRMCLRGELSEGQHEALEKYRTEKALYSAMVGGPRGDGAQDPNRVSGKSTNYDNPKKDASIKAAHEATISAIQDLQYECRNTANAWGAVYEHIDRDREVSNLFGDLRLVANCLIKRFGIEARAAA